jgi:hypothetical protein
LHLLTKRSSYYTCVYFVSPMRSYYTYVFVIGALEKIDN